MARCSSCGKHIDDMTVLCEDISECHCGGGIVINDDDDYDWDEY